MTSKQREELVEAAELLRFTADMTADDDEMGDDEREVAKAQEMVACALLKLLPQADDAELADKEWCEKNGATAPYHSGGQYADRWYWQFPTPAGGIWNTYVLVAFNDSVVGGGRTYLGICGSVVMWDPTRGDVRRLLAALGRPITGK